MIISLKLRRRVSIPVFVLAGALLFACLVTAESAGTAGKIVADLPPRSRAVIERLSILSALPDGAWKMHSGNLAHGEAVDLDDSSWQPIAVGSEAPTDAVWYRQTFQVPIKLKGYDLTGSRVWFKFDAWGGSPMARILYFNGRRVAMGDDLEQVVLFDDARPGDRVTVAVKMPRTWDAKVITGTTLRIEFPASRPNPDDLRREFESVAERISSDSPGDAAAMVTFNSAIQTVDLPALDAGDESKFDASLRAAHTKLLDLKPLLKQATFHLTGNSHIDAAWKWTWTETVDEVKRTFGTALQLMYEYPNYTYTQSTAAYNEWLAQKYPGMNAEIAQRIKEGRWEVAGGMWVEPDLNMPDGESLVRQLLVGKRWYKQAYGIDVRIGWNPDSFGYTWQLPQIYKKSGVDYFVTQKMTWNDTNQLPFKLFWWESPDGSKVLTYFPDGYGNVDMSPNRLGFDLVVEQQRAPGMTEMMDLYGVGDHGGGPTRAILDEATHWMEPGHLTPKYEFGTAQSFFSSIEKQIAPDSPEWNYQSIAKGYTPPAAMVDKVSIPTWDSELYLEYHRGIYTTQANHKRNMRDAEEQVLNAEKWSSLAWLDGKSYPADELTEDWKKVLFNQSHDLAAGSGIGVIYKDAQKDYDVVRWSTNEISSGALETVAGTIDTRGKGIPVIVMNPLGWNRSGDVKIKIQRFWDCPSSLNVADENDSAASESLPIRAVAIDKDSGITEFTVHVATVPAFGYKVLRVTSTPLDAGVKVALTTMGNETGKVVTLANARLSIAVDKETGCITSIKTASIKRGGIEFLAPGACGNQLQFFKDTPSNFDAWNIDPGTFDRKIPVPTQADSVVLIGKDSVNSAIRVTRKWQNSKFVQTISLPSMDSDYVDIDNEIDWHETHVLLKAAFPLAASGPFATYEIPYGTIDRPTTRNNSWEQAQFEVPALRWADLAGTSGDGKVYGLSILNESKYGYDAVGNVLRLTLLRSPVDPDPEADQGHHHFRFALYPHEGTWQNALTVRRGYEYNYPLTAVVTTAHPGSLPAEHSFASVAPENVVLTAVKKAEDANGLIFRAYECAGKESTVEFHVPIGAMGARVTNLMEVPEGSPLPVTDDVVKAPIRPYEILTIRVDYPSGGPKN
jgi:alpha-mannosidase